MWVWMCERKREVEVEVRDVLRREKKEDMERRREKTKAEGLGGF